MTEPARTVLLIEDNEQNRYLLTFLLEKRGFTVHSVTNGLSALELVGTLTPSVILLDIQLPSLDGYEVARRLRAHASLRATPIIAVTSYAMPGDREKAIAAGCTGYLEKPIDAASFVADVERIMIGPGEP